MKASPQFKSSKISVPYIPKYLSRRRLFEQINQAGDRCAIWIDAPPGSGKTTLASSYLDCSAHSHIWYQIDASDNDAASFFTGLAWLYYMLRPNIKKTCHCSHLNIHLALKYSIAIFLMNCTRV